MSKTSLMAMLTATALVMTGGKYNIFDEFGEKRKKTVKKVWNDKLKCYTINGKKVDKNGDYLEEE